MKPFRGPLAALALLALGLSPAAASGDKPRLLLTVDTPEPDSVVGDPSGMAFVSGQAMALFGEMHTFDIFFVIDASQSTAAPSGADIDGDGQIGHRRGQSFLSVLGKILPLPNSDSGDSVLAAEIAAVRVLLDQLDPRTTRTGVIYFSGDSDVLVPDAFTQVPLTSDYARVHRGLNEIGKIGPHGRTNMAAAVNLATVELLGTRSAYSEPRAGARKIVIFLTDGLPTLPYLSTLDNARAAISRAHRAAKTGIRIDTYAIGEDALSEPVVVVEMARVTQGVFTPVLHPKHLRTIFEEVSFAEIEELEIVNKTTNAPASYQIQNPDGTYSALLPMQEGTNVIQVSARSTDGSTARHRVAVRFLADAKVQSLTPRDIAQRNRLLENRLLELQKKRLEMEIQRDEAIRRDLKLAIEEQRRQAERRSEALRRELEIEIEE